MLDPDDRSIYTEAFTPPPNMVFDQAIGTSFSMDPSILLTVPIHLSLLTGSHDILNDGIAALESLRRLSNRITFFTQHGQMKIPNPPNVLYGMLESMIVEVKPPNGGVFHPKLWILRYYDPNDEESVLIRLIVLSRNLTKDRSWDVALTMDGVPTSRNKTVNRQLSDLILELPKLANGEKVDQTKISRAEFIANEVRRVEWHLPEDFDGITFYVIGFNEKSFDKKPWTETIGESKRLAVISPFCSKSALLSLAEWVDEPVALISRPETFTDLGADINKTYDRCLILNSSAETEDGEDNIENLNLDTNGLHAKIYIFECTWYTYLILGSANATHSAIETSKNVELLVELVGKKSVVGGIDNFLSTDGFGELLVPHSWDDVPDEDTDRKEAMKSLDSARKKIIDSSLKIVCNKVSNSELWQTNVVGKLSALSGISECKVWLITLPEKHATSVDVSTETLRIELGKYGASSVTGLLAIELHAEGYNLTSRFSINLSVSGIPDEIREAAVFKTVIKNKDEFIRYLQLFLRDYETILPPTTSNDGKNKRMLLFGGLNRNELLEDLVRAYSREPQRLQEIRSIIERLKRNNNVQEIIPADFHKIWKTFEKTME